MKHELCDSCNSPIIKVEKGYKFSIECSYCGKVYEKGTEVGGFISEYNGDSE